MLLHTLQHVPFEGLGSIETWARQKNATITRTRLFAAEPLPPLDQLDWLIVMGGPMSVGDEQDHPWLADEKRFIAEAIAAGKTVLGICLGAQLIASVLGAKVYPNRHKEIGWFPILNTDPQRFPALPPQLEAFHWHGDTFDIPAGACRLAESHACPNQAFLYRDRVLALQFHLETTPRSLQALMDNCGGELVEAPFIQTAPAMQADAGRFEAINTAMTNLLDWLNH